MSWGSKPRKILCGFSARVDSRLDARYAPRYERICRCLRAQRVQLVRDSEEVMRREIANLPTADEYFASLSAAERALVPASPSTSHSEMAARRPAELPMGKGRALLLDAKSWHRMLYDWPRVRSYGHATVLWEDGNRAIAFFQSVSK